MSILYVAVFTGAALTKDLTIGESKQVFSQWPNVQPLDIIEWVFKLYTVILRIRQSC